MTFAQTWDVRYGGDAALADPLPSPVRTDPVRTDPVPPGPVAASPVLPSPVPLVADGYCRCLLGLGPESAKAARDFTTATLRDWRLDSLVQEAVLIASELVTNAIRHGASCCAANGAGQALAALAQAQAELAQAELAQAELAQAQVELAWRRQASRLVCVVTDQSARPPVLAPADIDAESGRGLQIVQALAASWGWMMLGSRQKAVWAALLLPA
ncbi:MAG TPA: ATP-binding protein [Streptosporangiaceae bacterium]|nr:ATP-binding protein [Streptosporangiaceae bacterium]